MNRPVPPAEYNSFRLSPDEKRIVFSRTEDVSPDIWVLDMTRGVPTRITFDPAVDNIPIWSPDGLQIYGPRIEVVRLICTLSPPRARVGTNCSSSWVPRTVGPRIGRGMGSLFSTRNRGRKAPVICGSHRNPARTDAQKPFPYLESPFDKQNAVFPRTAIGSLTYPMSRATSKSTCRRFRSPARRNIFQPAEAPTQPGVKTGPRFFMWPPISS